MKRVPDRKVLIITEVFSPEDFLINDLVFTWQKMGYSLSVLTRNPSYPYGKKYPGYTNRLFQNEVIGGVLVHRVQFIPGYKSSRLIKITNYLWNMFLGGLWGIINGRKYKTIYIYHTGPLTFSAIGILIKKLFKVPVTIWTQDVWPDTVYSYGLARGKTTKRILEWFVRFIYSNCDNIVVSSPGFVQIVSKYAYPKEVLYLPQWSSTRKLSSHDTPPAEIDFPGTFNFVFAGNIGKVQNLENTIAGFRDFLQKKPDPAVWLNIFGDGSHLDYLKNYVDAGKIKNVKFWGRINSHDIPDYYKKADVLIISLENQPIFNLTIPAKFQSYLNAEKPIFGIIKGEVAKLIRDYGLGWIADPDDIMSISNLFLEVVNCPSDMMSAMSENTSKLLGNLFNREKIIQAFTQLAFHENLPIPDTSDHQ